MMETVMRPRKDGMGYSECSSPDELVGHGRCCHILGDSDQPSLEVIRMQRGMYEVKVDDCTMSIEGQREAVTKFFESLPKLDEGKIRNIVNFLNQEG